MTVTITMLPHLLPPGGTQPLQRPGVYRQDDNFASRYQADNQSDNHCQADDTENHGSPYNNDYASPLSCDHEGPNHQSGYFPFYHSEAGDDAAAYYYKADY